MKSKFCPNYGKRLIDESFYLKSFSSLIFNDEKENALVVPVKEWGVDCFHCNWEGEVPFFQE